MARRWAGVLAVLPVVACVPSQPVPTAPADPGTQAKVGTGEALDDRLVTWCAQQPNVSDQRCRCWPIALRAEGLGDSDLRGLLVRLGALDGEPDTTPLGPAFEIAKENCGLAGAV
jgi:hypothetical protein